MTRPVPKSQTAPRFARQATREAGFLKPAPADKTTWIENELHASLNWSDIHRITTYKYDLFAYDEICIRFETSGPDALSIEISEEWQGFREAKQMMETIFLNINEEWYFEVMLPAFKRNEAIIYEAGKI